MIRKAVESAKQTSGEPEQDIGIHYFTNLTESELQLPATPLIDNDKIGRQIGEMDIRAEEQLMEGNLTRNDLLMIARELREEGITVMGGRNTVYADDSSPFRNFEEAATFAGISSEQAILYSIGEDLIRIKLAVERKHLPPTGRDWFIDAHNFIDLLYAKMVDSGWTKNSA